MKKILLEDFHDYKFLSGLSFNPERQRAILTVKRSNREENGYFSDLYLLNAADNSLKALTHSGDVGISLWLDDEKVLFSAMRDKKLAGRVKEGEHFTCFYRLDINGGEAEEYMCLPKIVTGIKPLGGDKFVLSVSTDRSRADIESMSGEEKSRALAAQKAEGDYRVIDELPFWANGGGYTNGIRSEIYLYDRSKDEYTPVCSYPFDCGLQDAKDGKILYIAEEFEKGLMSLKNSLWLYDSAAGEKIRLVPKGKWHIHRAGFAGDKIYVLATDNERYGLNQNPLLYLYENGELVLWRGDDISYGSSVGSDCRLGGSKSFFACPHGVAFISTEGYSSYINTLTFAGKRDILPMVSGSVDGLDKSSDTLYFIGMRGGKLQELYSIKNGVETQISHFNHRIMADKDVREPVHFVYENDGVQLDGFVLTPSGYDENKKYPAVLDIHGGPKTVYGDVFYHEMQVWANMGYFVFFTNPRGGDGRGNEFADIRGRYGKEDYSDLMKFTDVVLEKYPRIDKSKVGVTGGSYGGFMTNWIIGHTQRFAAAASQRSISNWISMAYISDIGYYFAEDQTASTPWSNMELMWEQSPLKYADKVKTPTLFIHSDEDYRCPLPEGQQMFSALKYHGIEARLCMFKGENHELSRSGKPLHRQRRLEEITNWFEKFLK